MHQVARVVALVLCCAGAAAADQQTFQGRRLDEALRLLQQAGLPIVFSSGIVTPTMRVGAEPRATTPRQQLDDLLEPHGLKATEGPGGVILVVRAQALPAPRVTPSHAVDAWKCNPRSQTPEFRAITCRCTPTV